MARNYWIMLFSGPTWEEFLNNGANVAGFSAGRIGKVKKLRPGDYLICYLTGLTRLVGLLEVTSEFYLDSTPIWTSGEFPCRVKVKLLIRLKPEHAVPIVDLRRRLELFRRLDNPDRWGPLFMASPFQITSKDGGLLEKTMKQAHLHPVAREYDPSKYNRAPRPRGRDVF